MTKEEIQSKVYEIIVEQLNVDADDIANEKSFIDDLGADSLDVVELVMAMEEAFEMEIPDEEAENILKVGDVIDYIEKNQAA
ncbi:acyl carrier protein [bacterium]|nr:acyl carrier protein [bacterium]